MRWQHYPIEMMFPSEAVAAMRRQRASVADAAELLSLAGMAMRKRQAGEAIALLDLAIGRGAPPARALVAKAVALADLGRLADAAGAVATLSALPDGGPLAAAAHGHLLSRSGVPARAAAGFQRALSAGFAPAWVLRGALTCFDAAGRLPELPDLLLALPPSWRATADYLDVLAEALAAAGRPDEAAALVDPDRLVSIGDLRPELERLRGPGSMAALEVAVGSRPGYVRDPEAKSTSGGLQSSLLLSGDHEPIAFLLDLVKRNVEEYCARLGGDDTPFAASRPHSARLKAWSVILETGGCQTEHLHPSGWLSGVFYVACPAPRTLCGAAGAESGLLEVPLRRGAKPAPWPVRRIRPEPGMIVLFPSHFRHRTFPHLGAEPRVCVAFDVVPS